MNKWLIYTAPILSTNYLPGINSINGFRRYLLADSKKEEEIDFNKKFRNLISNYEEGRVRSLLCQVR